MERLTDADASEEITEDGGSTDIGVNGEFAVGEAAEVVSVQLSWTDTLFTYTVQHEWDDEQYIDVLVEGSGSWSQTPATVTVINHSNQNIDAGFSFTPDYAGITGKFTSDAAGTDEISQISLESAANGNVEKIGTVYFFVTGGELPDTQTEAVKIGDITITVIPRGN